MFVSWFDCRLVPKQNYAEYSAGCYVWDEFMMQTTYAGTEQKTYENAHRKNLVHDCVDVIELYDRNLFYKHQLIQKLSESWVCLCTKKFNIYNWSILKYIENFMSKKWKMSHNNEYEQNKKQNKNNNKWAYDILISHA